MTKEVRKIFGIKKMRQQGLSYIERGEKIRNKKNLNNKKEIKVEKKIEPKIEIKKPIIKTEDIKPINKISLWKKILNKIKKL